MTDRSSAMREPLFQAAATTLRHHIQTGLLKPGLVLLEGPISDRLAISRTSVKRALLLLEEEALIHRFDGRGFLVGTPDDAVSPVREDLPELELAGAEVGGKARPGSQHIQDTVERDILACLVFGQYRMTETDLAAHFDVSRTVARDILGRLQERGLVWKTSTSRWVSALLTARSIKDKYELRGILEVAALRSAASRIDISALDQLQRKMERTENGKKLVNAEEWFELVNAFVDLTILSTPNIELRALVSRNFRMISASQQVLFSVGLSGDRYSIRELRMVIELLRVGAIHGAAEVLESHLAKSRERMIAQLKIVSVLPEPDHLAPYLTPVEPGQAVTSP